MGQKFSFNNNAGTSTLSVTFEGRFEKKDGNDFISEYKNTIKSIDATKYVLDLDCIKLTVATPDVAAQLGDCFKMYSEDNFKMVKFRLGNNIVLKMQFDRLAKQAGLKNYEFVS